MNDPQPEAIHALLAAIAVTDDFTLALLAGGANNRAFRLDVGEHSFLLKAYFRHPDDPRDRLGAEFAFSRFAWDRGIRYIPQPLAADPIHALGLYAFVPGRAPQPDEVSVKAVDAAMDFFSALNRHRNHPEAAALPNGSESCFSLSEHLRTVERRVLRLDDIPPGDARDFVQRELRPLWAEVVTQTSGPGMDDTLSPQNRCLSPSDFGFHNAIISVEDALIFIDFEYAGWDDPAKLVCDFFCQPRVPVPMTHYDRVIKAVSAGFPAGDALRQRIDLLLPVYQIKWCCIMLNHLLPAGGARRRFAGGDVHLSAQIQLEKAKAIVEQVSRRIR
jgi:hypothetical protein